MNDRVALVTGASRGIGRATAIALGDAGFAVGIVARSAPQLEETRVLVERTGAAAVAAFADVTDATAVARAVAEIEANLGPVTFLVNNAGSLRAIGPTWEVDPEAWWSDVSTTLAGAYNCCRIVPRMIERSEGRIVNLTSYAGVRPAQYQSGYGCGKAALNSFTESLAMELGELGVSVFGAAAGFTQTEMTEHLTSSEAGRKWLPTAGSGSTVTPEQTARLIVRLAEGSADGLSGRLLHTLDEVDVLLAEIDEIRRDDLYAPRLRRLPGR
jgi:NAD(P)-dependent dehydrogenase (short-subunit alcohol dehydrogenase family)